MNNTKLIGLILAVLLLLSLSASAMADNIGPGVTRETNNEQIGTNEGTVTNNYGTVTNNYGTVTNNHGTVGYNGTAANHENAIIKNNYGTVDTNYGNVNDNLGTVVTNNGYISRNGPESATSDIGTVDNNNGTIALNYGTVVNNEGTVDSNFSGTVRNNTGTVVNNYGTVYNKTEGGQTGTVTNNRGTIITPTNDCLYGIVIMNRSGYGRSDSGYESVIEGEIITPVTRYEAEGSKLTGYETVNSTSKESVKYNSEESFNLNSPIIIYLYWEQASDPVPGPQPGPSGGGSGSSGSETYVVVMPHTLEPSAGGKGMTLNCSTLGGSGSAEEIRGARIVKVNFANVDEDCYTVILKEDGNIEINFTDEFLASLPGGIHMVSVIVNGFTYTSQLNIPFV